MKTGRTKGTLLARLERLEIRRVAANAKIKVRFGHLRRLPPDYKGERHVVVAKKLPSQSGQEWVEFEEVPGPDPNLASGYSLGVPEYLDVVFVGHPQTS